MSRDGHFNDKAATHSEKIEAALRSTSHVARLLLQLHHADGGCQDLAPARREDAVRHGSPPRLDLAEKAERLYRQRRKRDVIFDASLFGEPAFDILLDLYVAQVRGSAISVSSSCIAAAVPATTALRYIAMLETKRLIRRSVDPFDARRSFLSLTEEAIDLMERFLSSNNQ